MEFETQYKIFVVALLLGVCFYVAGDALTSAIVEGKDFLLFFFIKLGVKIAIFALIILISLFFLGVGTLLGPYISKLKDVHLVYAHLTTLSAFAVYGIYLTVNNLSIYFNGVRVVEYLPIYIPMYVSIFGIEVMTRYLLIVLAVAGGVVKDVIDLREGVAESTDKAKDVQKVEEQEVKTVTESDEEVGAKQIEAGVEDEERIQGEEFSPDGEK